MSTDEPPTKPTEPLALARKHWSRRAWLPWAGWVLGALGFVTCHGLRPIHVGRMELPRVQAVAISVTIVVVVSLLAAWALMGWRALARRWRVKLAASVFDRPPVRRLLWALLVISAVAYGYARCVEPRWVVTRRIPLGRVHIPTVHRPPVRLVVLSDLHVDADREPFASLASRVNALEPDLVVLLGDLLNTRSALDVLQRTLRDIRAPAGKLAVQGNWEAWYWSDLPLLEGTGFEWLHRRVAKREIRGQTLHLLGWPYRDGDDGAGAERMLASLPSEDWRIFAHHTPDLVLRVPSADLALAGHTHGGQISLPLFGAMVTLSRYGKRFERGLIQVGPTRLYVNPGIGVEPSVPLRLGVRPEITLLLLGAKDQRPLADSA